ncbi:DUF2585 domain-containing protein [Sphingomonas rosea]|uniref:DUF2585 domain-containing protein n=1 Tax=Sphingomonas rosea TaxID=335605 RepID=A0ABP7TQ87_9SPHN
MFVKNLRPYAATLAVVIAAAAILWLMGRPPTYKHGLIELWGPVGPKQSQMLFDWYTASHIVHGFLFYGLLHLVGRPKKIEDRLLLATIVEAAWELVENSPVIINRYREATIALGYRGDSILNSVSDIACMILGFLLARRLPVWASVMIVLVLELVPLAIIRDNLTLNVWMLVHPSDGIRAWQAGA